MPQRCGATCQCSSKSKRQLAVHALAHIQLPRPRRTLHVTTTDNWRLQSSQHNKINNAISISSGSSKFMQSSMATANGFDCSKSFSRNLVKILKLKMHCSPGTTLAMSSSESSESIELGQSCQKPSESASLQMWLVLCGGVWHSAQLCSAWPGLLRRRCNRQALTVPHAPL